MTAVAVYEKLFWRDAFYAQLALHFSAANLDRMDRKLNLHAHFVHLDGHFHGMLDHVHVIFLDQERVLVIRQVGVGVDFRNGVVVPIRLHDALLLDHGVLECVV